MRCVPSGPRVSRRALLISAVGGGVVVATGGAIGWQRTRHAELLLHSETVAVTSTGARVFVPVGHGSEVVPGTRVLRTDPSAAALVADERTWLASGRVALVDGEWSELVRSSLLDLRSLTLANGASLAGWSQKWRYAWPRDAAHVAVALAVAGFPAEALQILTFLQRVQRADGSFEARYLPDGSGPPDDRPAQSDGSGWVLWASAQLASRALVDVRPLRPMVDAASVRILELIENPRALPPVSPDYWEVPEHSLTLGVAAPLLAGLEAAVELYDRWGDGAATAQVANGVVRLRAAIEGTFGRAGYPRHIDGEDRDAAVTFLLRPYVAEPLQGAAAAVVAAARTMQRPAGGLAPGAGWKDDGISWTPETASFALAAAAGGDAATARARLSWLAQHRTTVGSFPEKVLFDGRPASVAPLAWTAALVILAVDALT